VGVRVYNYLPLIIFK